MRIGVIGTGAVGGAFAARLHAAGHEVAVVARGDALDAIRAEGLRLTGAFGDTVARVEADTVLRSPVELALCATKAHDSEAALRASAETGALAATDIVVLQNGLSGPATAARVLGSPERVLGGLSLFAATNRGLGRVDVTAAGATFVGAGRGPAGARATRVAGILDGALPTTAIANFEGAQWTKLLINHVNALPAITGTSVQDVSAHAGLRRVLTASMRESVRVARRIGVRFAPLGMLKPWQLAAVGALPLALGQAVPRRMGRAFGEVPNPASTLQSIRRGQPTEIDELNGRVSALGREAGVPTPVNDALVALVHEVERTGRFLSADEAVRRAGLS